MHFRLLHALQSKQYRSITMHMIIIIFASYYAHVTSESMQVSNVRDCA